MNDPEHSEIMAKLDDLSRQLRDLQMTVKRLEGRTHLPDITYSLKDVLKICGMKVAWFRTLYEARLHGQIPPPYDMGGRKPTYTAAEVERIQHLLG